ncbi:MAG TPA: hypothetical protein VNQ76_17090 [Planctomicrobium sp.]|nr:hypothetical protein [Planctomicrobium sp.]
MGPVRLLPYSHTGSPLLAYRRDFRSLFIICLPVLWITIIQGCGKSSHHHPASAEGLVTFRGEPIQKGVIRFQVEDGTPGAGGLGPIEDGQYQIPLTSGLKSGTYTVSIYGFRKTGRVIKIDESTPPVEEEKQFIPRQYNDEATVFHQVLPGDNTLNFSLE